MSILYPKRRQFCVPRNGKIADITHADTLEHSLNIQTALGETRRVVAITVVSERAVGTGILYAYGLTGNPTYWLDDCHYRLPTITLVDANLYYRLSVANDDFDLYCRGYVVEA